MRSLVCWLNYASPFILVHLDSHPATNKLHRSGMWFGPGVTASSLLSLTSKHLWGKRRLNFLPFVGMHNGKKWRQKKNRIVFFISVERCMHPGLEHESTCNHRIHERSLRRFASVDLMKFVENFRSWSNLLTRTRISVNSQLRRRATRFVLALMKQK